MSAPVNRDKVEAKSLGEKLHGAVVSSKRRLWFSPWNELTDGEQTSFEIAGLAFAASLSHDETASAVIAAQAEAIAELVGALKAAKSYGNLYYRQRIPNQNEGYCDAVDRINALLSKALPNTGEQSQ